MRLIHLCGAACIASFLPSWAFADVIFDQSVDLTEAFGPLSDFTYGSQAADDFVLQPGASTVTDIHWWGTYSTIFCCNTGDNFTIRIFDDISGAPGINPVFDSFVGDIDRIDTGVDASPFDVFAYSVNISPLPLLANTTYWLSIVNNTEIFDPDDLEAWSWSSGNFGNATSREEDGQAWGPFFGGEQAFQLTNDAVAVPEPATWALFAAGLAGLGWVSRRRKIARLQELKAGSVLAFSRRSC